MKKRFFERAYSSDFPGRDDVLLLDVLPINTDQLLKVVIISTNSPRKQGVYLIITAGRGYIECEGERSRGISLWCDSPPREWIIKCHSVPKLITIYNAFEDYLFGSTRGMPDSFQYKSGMLVEENGDKRIYHCKDKNDGSEIDTFDNLVFSVEKLPAP